MCKANYVDMLSKICRILQVLISKNSVCLPVEPHKKPTAQYNPAYIQFDSEKGLTNWINLRYNLPYIFRVQGGAMSRIDPRENKEKELRTCGALNPRSHKVTDELFAERAFFDARDLVQVKYEMLRRVQHDGKPVSQAAATFGFSRPSYYQIQSAFEAQGLPALLPQKRGPRKAHKLSPEILDFISEKRAEDISLNAKSLAALVEERFAVTLHPRTIERGLSGKKNRLKEEHRT
jgi:transposase